MWGIERPLTRRSPEPGRHVFGAATLALGVITLAWHNYRDWEQLRYILNAASGPVFLYVVAVAQIFGGGAILYRRTSGTGAVAAGVVYLVFALLCVPRIVSTPQVYDSWGNFFEQFSRDRRGFDLCAIFVEMGAGNGESDGLHFFGNLRGFVRPRTGVLSESHRRSGT